MKKLWIVFLVVLALSTSASADEWIPCIDSDGGHDYSIKGTTIGSHWSEANGQYYTMEETDYCTGVQNYLIEYFCDDEEFNPEELRKEQIWCENGCDAGTCIENEVPEFGLIAGGLAFIGAIGAFFLLRK